jgi:glycosyltransferase involved in cell wall biosynthesis
VRILFVNEKLGWFGGVEQNIADTAAGLRDRGIECRLAWGEETTRDPAGYTALFAGVDRCSVHGGAGESLDALVRRHRPDVVYFHKVARLPDLEGLPRAVRMVHDHDLCCPRKHKYFAHNAHVCHHPAGWRCWLDLAFIERARGTALGVRLRPLGNHHAEMRRNRALDLCLVGSRFMRDELAMNGFAADRVEILPPVVRMRAPAVSDAAADPHILYVGQLIRGKGVDLLLEALARVRQPFRATIIGEGNARPALEAQCAALKLGDRVRFLGWVPNAELGAHYAAARVLAVPARWPEPFGMIGLEAMHHARPVVAFAVGGIPDWLVDGTTGFLVPERDTGAYAAALDRLLADRDLATRMGRAGLERVHSVYTFEGYLDRLVTLLAGGNP